MRVSAVVGTVLLALWVPAAIAADGAVPLWEPTTISESGKYVLTRNIVAGMNPVLTISADDVAIDLNGFKVEGVSGPFEADVILVSAGTRGVTIEDGTVVGGGAGLRFGAGSSQFHLRRLTFRGGRTGIGIASGSAHGIVENTIIENASDEGINVSGTGMQLRANVISASINGLVVESCSSCQITENTIQDAVLLGMSINSGNGNLVMRNTVSAAGTGIRVSQGGYHHFEANVLSDNSNFGLHLMDSSFQNVYRGNTARNNGGTCPEPGGNADFCDEGAGNTSHGDNYLPDQR